MARVDVDGVAEEVSVELIDAAVGDIVLVHAKVAIGRLP
jgi:hydrogenase maturation factor